MINKRPRLLYTIIACLTVSGLTLYFMKNPSSGLDRIIRPEIKNDAFYSAIYNISSSENIKTILEIGSSSGEGSTQAFVEGIMQNPNHPTLFCMELSRRRFAKLQKHYAKNPFVICYNVSSVPLETFAKEEEILFFMETVNTPLRNIAPKEVLSWLSQDIEYVKQANVSQNGIELIKKEQSIEDFDVVLIDGSEFTGQAEFKLIYGAKFILLDDICNFKNYHNYKKLLEDTKYQLFEENLRLRNGYAIFKKI